MVVYNEIAHLKIKMDRRFKEGAVYNVIPQGGINVGNQSFKSVNTRFVSPQDLNSLGTLFGGRLLAWFDADAAAFAYNCVEDDKCVFTTVSMYDFNFKRPVKSGARIRGTMELVHHSSSTLTIKGIYEFLDNDWAVCAEGYCSLCAIENGKPTLLPQLVTVIDQNSMEWEFVEKYKKLTRLKKKELLSHDQYTITRSH